MPPAGDEALAQWREAGEWWDRKPQRSVRRFIDPKGIRREVVTELEPLPIPKPEDFQGIKTYTSSWNQRDNKVARACGNLQKPHPSEAILTPRRKPVALLHTLSAHSFGKSALMAGAITHYAGEADASAVLLADRFSLSGVIEFKDSVANTGVRPLYGASFEMENGGDLVLVATNKIGFRSLSRLITECHLDESRLFPLCNWERLSRHSEGLLCLTGGDDGPLNRLLIQQDFESAQTLLDRLIGLYGREKVFVQVERTDLPWQISLNRRLLELAEKSRVLPVAGGPLTHAHKRQFAAQDMLVCIDSLCLIEEVEGRKPRRDPRHPTVQLAPRRALNAERHIRPWADLRELYADRPDLLENTMRVAELCEEDVFPEANRAPSILHEREREITPTGL